MDKTLLPRTWSGLLFVAVLLGAVCWCPESACAVLFLLALGVLREFYGVWLQTSRKWKWLAMLPGVYLLGVTVFFLYGQAGPLWFAGLVPVMLVLMALELFSSGEDPLRRLAVIWWGVAYIAVPFAMMMHLATLPDGQKLLPGFFLLTWVNDSGAYLIGITFGKHRLMPRISPLKSWEGFWGGAVCALLLLVPDKNFSDMCYGLEEVVIFSLIIDIVVGGKRTSYQLLVLSERYEQIADHIIRNMDRGVTVLKAQGWFTKADRNVLLILINQNQLSDLSRVIKEIDPRAFMSISPTHNVYGEGFEEIKTGVSLKKKKHDAVQ